MNLDSIISIGMEMIAQKGWAYFNLLSLARHTQTDFYALTRIIPDKQAFILTTFTWVEATLLQHPSPSEQNPTDQLFEMIMIRLEALTPFRPGLKEIKSGLLSDLNTGPALLHAWTCHLNQYFKNQPEPQAFHSILVVGLYLKTFWTWLDDGDDNSKIMQRLDQDIKNLMDIKKTFSDWFCSDSTNTPN